GRCVFYEDYHYPVANASVLDLSKAIGAARSAERLPVDSRGALLDKAAEDFTYSQEVLEHTVRLTGMPVTLVQTLLSEIPQWLRQVPEMARGRFTTNGQKEALREQISAGKYWKLLSSLVLLCGHTRQRSALSGAGRRQPGLHGCAVYSESLAQGCHRATGCESAALRRIGPQFLQPGLF
ncbi:MAG: hypothetical protein P8074_24495, partial [Anaerolineales bacterium]